MAGKVTLEYHHAVYDTFTYKRGAELDIDKTWLGNLLRAADATFVRSKLDKSGEFFFNSTNKWFVLGFERKRWNAPRDDMAFFDLFAIPLHQAQKIPLEGFPPLLNQYLVDSYNNEPTPAVRNLMLEVDDDNSPQWDEHGNPVEETVDAAFIADMWEQFRRDSVELEASLADVSEFVDAVDGMLSAVSFASVKRSQTTYFDIISGEYEPQFESQELQELRRTVKELSARGRLERELLPTYAEELQNKRRRDQAAVRHDDRLSDAIEDTFDKIANNATTHAERIPEQAASLMEQANKGHIVDDDDDGGIRSRVTGLVNSDDGPNVLDTYNYHGVEREVVETIDQELNEQSIKLKRKIDEQLLRDLQKELERRIDEKTATLAEETVERLADTNTSQAHEEADPEEL